MYLQNHNLTLSCGAGQ